MKSVYHIVWILIIMISGCTESSIITVWKAKGIDFPTYRTVMVLGPRTDSDTTLRTYMENHLAGDLNDVGYLAISAHEAYGADRFQNMSIKGINQILKDADVQALFTIVLLKKEMGTMYIPGAFYLMPSSLYPDNYYDVDKGSHDMRYDPGYYTNYSNYLWI